MKAFPFLGGVGWVRPWEPPFHWSHPPTFPKPPEGWGMGITPGQGGWRGVWKTMDRDRSDGKTTRPDGFRGSGRGRRNVFRSEPWQESGDQATSASRWNDASLPSSRTAWCKSCNRRGPLVEHNTGHVTPLPQRTVEEIHVTKGDASISATTQNALGTMEGGVDTNGARGQRLGRPDARSEGVVGWPRSRRLDSDLVLAEGNRRPRGQDDHRVHRRIGQCRRLDGEWIAPLRCVWAVETIPSPHNHWTLATGGVRSASRSMCRARPTFPIRLATDPWYPSHSCFCFTCRLGTAPRRGLDLHSLPPCVDGRRLAVPLGPIHSIDPVGFHVDPPF
eukprot:scaffold1347_cov350-Pavlova_lutheri.AAC.53